MVLRFWVSNLNFVTVGNDVCTVIGFYKASVKGRTDYSMFFSNMEWGLELAGHPWMNYSCYFNKGEGSYEGTNSWEVTGFWLLV